MKVIVTSVRQTSRLDRRSVAQRFVQFQQSDIVVESEDVESLVIDYSFNSSKFREIFCNVVTPEVYLGKEGKGLWIS